jgi:hypothetical protein
MDGVEGTLRTCYLSGPPFIVEAKICRRLRVLFSIPLFILNSAFSLSFGSAETL